MAEVRIDPERGDSLGIRGCDAAWQFPLGGLNDEERRKLAREMRTAGVSYAKAVGAPTDVLGALGVALGEASANAVLHACGATTARMVVRVEEGMVAFTVLDDGAGVWNPTEVLRKEAAVAAARQDAGVPDSDGGRGLLVMQELCDHLAVTCAVDERFPVRRTSVFDPVDRMRGTTVYGRIYSRKGGADG